MGTKTNQRLYVIEILMFIALISLAYFVVGNVNIVTKELLIFSLVINIVLFKREVKNVVSHLAIIGIMILNSLGIWFQYTLYGVSSSEAPMNYYMLADVITAFIIIFVVYLSITGYIKKGVKEMSFETITDYDEYVKEFKLLIAAYLMVALFTTFELAYSYTEIRKCLLVYAPTVDSFTTRYLQYLIFCAVPCLTAIGLGQLPKDLRKEVEVGIEERDKEQNTV